GAQALAIVNAEDPASPRMVRDCSAQVVWCTLSGATGPDGAAPSAALPPGQVRGTAPTQVSAAIHALATTGFRATFTGPWGEIEAEVPLVGRHNVMNTLQALCAAHRV